MSKTPYPDVNGSITCMVVCTRSDLNFDASINILEDLC